MNDGSKLRSVCLCFWGERQKKKKRNIVPLLSTQSQYPNVLWMTLLPFYNITIIRAFFNSLHFPLFVFHLPLILSLLLSFFPIFYLHIIPKPFSFWPIFLCHFSSPFIFLALFWKVFVSLFRITWNSWGSFYLCLVLFCSVLLKWRKIFCF